MDIAYYHTGKVFHSFSLIKKKNCMKSFVRLGWKFHVFNKKKAGGGNGDTAQGDIVKICFVRFLKKNQNNMISLF